MNKQRVLLGLILLLLYQAPTGSALINPVPYAGATPPWMVSVLVTTESSENFYSFCSGSLIQKYWVLAANTCFSDHFKVLENYIGDKVPIFVAYFESNGKAIEVEEVVKSPDNTLAMFKLKEPATVTPISIAFTATRDLLTSQASILGFKTSSALSNNLFNPAGNLPAACRISGTPFIKSGTFCYILSYPSVSTELKVTTGVIFDPSKETGSLTTLDSFEKVDTSGRKIYINFSSSNSYPCAEDLGAPVLVEQNGQLVQVGMVFAVGSVIGLPMCSGSIVNYFASLSLYEDFITSTIALSEPELLCPATPRLYASIINSNRVALAWTKVSGASGYQALVTTSVGFEPIQVFDLGNINQLSTTVDPSKVYTLAVQAYNASCTGPMSEVRTLAFP